ncbi:MAG: hypothetical protein KAI72_10710, partial [Candidatus Pacebacteria bacterium]|nr:hypothetical protein [Candidatus Paceibacterota bacterium]
GHYHFGITLELDFGEKQALSAGSGRRHRRLKHKYKDCLGGRGFLNNPNIHQSNANPKGKSLFAKDEMSFGVANCSGFLKKRRKC